MFPFNLLFLVLSRGGETEKQPWEKGNSWLVTIGATADVDFLKVNYNNVNVSENITIGAIANVDFIYVG